MSSEHTDALSELRVVAALRGYPALPLARLVAYVEEVLEQGRSVNLTAAHDVREAVRILAWTALAVVEAWGRSTPPRCVADLGTGNGLPGVAAALAWPDARVLLVERRQKKARAVAVCTEAGGIGNVEVLALDGREVLPRHPELRAAVDLVTVRAVGPLADTTRIVAAWLAPGGVVAHWKGAGLDPAEVAAGESAAREAGLGVCPGIEHADAYGPAHLVRYQRPANPRHEKES